MFSPKGLSREDEGPFCKLCRIVLALALVAGAAQAAPVVRTEHVEAQLLAERTSVQPGKSGTIGQPLPGTRIRLLDREDPTKLAPEGEPGELAFAGPQTMKGYWNHAEVDADIFAGEWLRTGDVATLDEMAFLRITDRTKDLIKSGGEWISSVDLENALMEELHDVSLMAPEDDLDEGAPEAAPEDSPQILAEPSPATKPEA